MSTLAYEGQNLVQRYGGREALAVLLILAAVGTVSRPR